MAKKSENTTVGKYISEEEAAKLVADVIPFQIGEPAGDASAHALLRLLACLVKCGEDRLEDNEGTLQRAIFARTSAFCFASDEFARTGTVTGHDAARMM